MLSFPSPGNSISRESRGRMELSRLGGETAALFLLKGKVSIFSQVRNMRPAAVDCHREFFKVSIGRKNELFIVIVP